MNWFNIVAIVLIVVIDSIGIYDYRQDRRGVKLDIFENKEEILEYLKYKRQYSYVYGKVEHTKGIYGMFFLFLNYFRIRWKRSLLLEILNKDNLVELYLIDIC